MKPLNRHGHSFSRHWFGSTSELIFRDETQVPSIVLLGCPDHAMLPYCLPVSNPNSFLVAQHLGFAISHFADPPDVATLELLDEVIHGYEVTDFIICSHTNCLISRQGLASEADSNLTPYCDVIKPTLQFIQHKYPDAFEMEIYGLFLREHILLQLENLIEYASIKSRLEDGRLKIHGWLFDEGSRRLRAFDPLEGEFVSVDANASVSPIDEE